MLFRSLGLDDVLYDPRTKTIYTPNTNKTGVMGEAALREEPDGDMIEPRANPNHDPHNGRFTSGSGGLTGSGKADKSEKEESKPPQQKSIALQETVGKKKQTKTKYAPSKQRNSDFKIQLPPKKYSRLCGTLGTIHPGLKAGDIRRINDGKKSYLVKADGYGGFETLEIVKIK